MKRLIILEYIKSPRVPNVGFNDSFYLSQNLYNELEKIVILNESSLDLQCPLKRLVANIRLYVGTLMPDSNVLIS